MNRLRYLAVLTLLAALTHCATVSGWSNGGYSADPSNPDYGTHDWIAQHALDWLPLSEKQYIVNSLAAYLYGTELPDNGQALDGIGDTVNHHFYYNSAGAVTDDAAAVRASAVYTQALNFLRSGDSGNAAKYAGIMSHYIVDLAVFGHVMGSGTDWGAETHHSDYEDYVNAYTSYSANFFTLSFDGSLALISAYDAAKDLAYDTTFDLDGDLTTVWMDQHYDWNDPAFRNRAGESINLAVNYLADVLYTLHSESSSSNADHVVINEVELNPPGEDDAPGAEWVELYNPTGSAVDIGGWKVATADGRPATVTIAAGTSIPAHGYYVVTYSGQWLDNKDEYIILQNSAGAPIDTPDPFTDEKNDEKTWQRYPDGADNWIFTDPSTKNTVNIPEFPIVPLLLPIAILLAVAVLRVRLTAGFPRRLREKKNRENGIRAG